MRFDGDIIITDPCYIVKRREIDFSSMPYWWDYVTKTKVIEEDGQKRYMPPSATDYPDCRRKTLDDFSNEKVGKAILMLNSGDTYFSPTMEAEWEAYHKAESKWNQETEDDWDKCDCGENMGALGFQNYIAESTFYGDWNCITLNSDTNEELGKFCADAGMVGVFLLSEVLKYNPDYDDYIKKLHCVTLIKDFHGNVDIIHSSSEENNGENEVCVVGTGNINFRTQQIGL